jgi:hypothetical protein
MEESLPERIFGTTFALVCDTSTLSPVLPILTYGCGLPSAAMDRITMNTYCCILTTACSERKCGTGFTEGTWSILHAKGRIDWIAQDISWRISQEGTARKRSRVLGLQLFSICSSSGQERRGVSCNEEQRKVEAARKSRNANEDSLSPRARCITGIGAKRASYYMSLIDILRWIVELGRVDVCLECSMMSSYMALPREGHLYELFQIFGYLKKYHNTEMVFDPSDPVVDQSSFELKD